MNFSLRQTSLVVIGCMVASTAFGATVRLESLLLNPSFESPVSPGFPAVCPTSWGCSGSPAPGFATYQVTAQDYTAGANGLSGGRLTPDGTQAAYSPTIIEGSGNLVQSIAGLTYVAGNTYSYSFYVGRPLNVPDNLNCQGVNPGGGPCPVGGFPDTAQFYFTANGVQSSLPSFSITDPGAGQWQLVTESFTAAPGAAYLGQTVGVDFFVVAGMNQQAFNLDAVSVPEPSSGLLSLLAITGFYVSRYKRLRAK